MASCVAVIAGTIVYTALRYRELPERVPIHFGLMGGADGFGPKPAIWLLVVVQVLVAVVYLTASQAAGQRLLYVGLLTIVLLAWLQAHIVAVAIDGTNRLQPARLYTAVALFCAGVALSIFVLH